MPRFTTRFGHPETTHFTMVTEPSRAESSRAEPSRALTAHPSPVCDRSGPDSGATRLGAARPVCLRRVSRLFRSDRKRRVSDPEIQQRRKHSMTSVRRHLPSTWRLLHTSTHGQSIINTLIIICSFTPQHSQSNNHVVFLHYE